LVGGRTDAPRGDGAGRAGGIQYSKPTQVPLKTNSSPKNKSVKKPPGSPPHVAPTRLRALEGRSARGAGATGPRRAQIGRFVLGDFGARAPKKKIRETQTTAAHPLLSRAITIFSVRRARVLSDLEFSPPTAGRRAPWLGLNLRRVNVYVTAYYAVYGCRPRNTRNYGRRNAQGHQDNYWKPSAHVIPRMLRRARREWNL